MAISHFALELSSRHERRHRVNRDHAERQVKRDRAGWHRFNAHPGRCLAEFHDRALTKATLDLRDCQIDRTLAILIIHAQLTPRCECLAWTALTTARLGSAPRPFR